MNCDNCDNCFRVRLSSKWIASLSRVKYYFHHSWWEKRYFFWKLYLSLFYTFCIREWWILSYNFIIVFIWIMKHVFNKFLISLKEYFSKYFYAFFDCFILATNNCSVRLFAIAWCCVDEPKNNKHNIFSKNIYKQISLFGDIYPEP